MFFYNNYQTSIISDQKMMLYIFLCSILTFTIVYSEKHDRLSTNSTQEISSNLPLNEVAIANDKTRLALPSEGGTLIANTPDFSLLKDKQQVSLLELDKELDKPKETSIKARKGAPIFADKQTTVVNTTDLQNSTNMLKPSNAKNESNIDAPKTLVSKNSTLAISKPTNSTTVTPKKPQVLSYEALAAADKDIHVELKIQNSNPSSKTLPNLTNNQIPSPNEDGIIKVYPSRATSHPGMIMPIVITILVVPMFAIVGYMALKRGQEAWKNRHYKRMDFLLDGMYND